MKLPKFTPTTPHRVESEIDPPPLANDIPMEEVTQTSIFTLQSYQDVVDELARRFGLDMSKNFLPEGDPIVYEGMIGPGARAREAKMAVGFPFFVIA